MSCSDSDKVVIRFGSCVNFQVVTFTYGESICCQCDVNGFSLGVGSVGGWPIGAVHL